MRSAGQVEAGGMKRIAIAGVGLIGASFALALRQAGFRGELVGISSPRSIETGIKVGAISRGVALEEAAATADLIYLSQPIEAIVRTLSVLGPIARKDCLITDAGSTKTTIVETANRYVRMAQFLGGHPMAGKESRGAETADPDLFAGRPYVLTPTASAGDTGEFRQWLERIGARVIEMKPREHDETVAFTSHLPQLLSTALAATLANKEDGHISEVFGPGLIDMTRLALSAPEVWMSVLRTNRPAVNEALSAYAAMLAELQNKLNDDNLEQVFSVASTFSRQLRKKPFTGSTSG
ncbi:MAG: prephenate dehydrogenase [Bryobacterales bacterium]|nr:prephenate dehydrogenase [Bryobacterales bacterium]